MKIALLTTDNRAHERNYSAPQPYFGTAPEALLQGFQNLAGVEVHVISCVQQPVASPEKIAPNIFYHSLVVPKTGWMRTFYSGCIRAVRQKLRTIQPDIVHGQGTERDCAISAALSGFPSVLTIHGNMRLVAEVNRAKPFSFLWLAGKLERFTLPRTDGVVCISSYTRTAVEALAPRTWLLPNAVDASFFEINAAPDPALPPVIACVGMISTRKNQNDFIRALDALAAQKKFRVIFLGKVEADAYGMEFQRLVEQRDWCEHVPFSGRERVKELLQTASILALPTREDNCPMVVLEAMAAGVPVLASKVGGVPDLIRENETGIFCDPQDPKTFATGLQRLLDDPSFNKRLLNAAKLEAQKRFHPQMVAGRHLEIYREVLKLKK